MFSLPTKIASEKSEGTKKIPTIPMLNLPNQPPAEKRIDIEDMPTKKGVPLLKISDLKRKESPQGSFKHEEGELGPILSQINKY